MPRPSSPKARRTAIKKSDVCPAAQSVLLEWRVETHSRDFPHAMHSPAAILPDLLIEILASIGPVNEQNLRESLQSKWALYDQYKESILTALKEIPLAQYTTAMNSGSKRKSTVGDEVDIELEDGNDVVGSLVLAPPVAVTQLSTTLSLSIHTTTPHLSTPSIAILLPYATPHSLIHLRNASAVSSEFSSPMRPPLTRSKDSRTNNKIRVIWSKLIRHIFSVVFLKFQLHANILRYTYSSF